MKVRFATKTLIALISLLALGAAVWVGQTAAEGPDAQTTISTFEIEGMTCGGCEVGVKLKVEKIDGVTSADASYDDGSAVVTYDPEKVTPKQIIAAINEMGYSAKLAENKAER